LIQVAGRSIYRDDREFSAMALHTTDREWEKYGNTDPYFGVIVDERFRQKNLTEQNKRAFFETGDQHCAALMEKIRNYHSIDFIPQRALDFGCGVGRVTLPLAKIARQVVGMDISAAMLAEAGKNCTEQNINNVTFLKSDDKLSALTGNFDFIHSSIVFQHIPSLRGYAIFKILCDSLSLHGVAAVHFTVGYATWMRNFIARIKYTVPFAPNFINLIKGKKFWTPQMQIYSYDLRKLLSYIRTLTTDAVHVHFSDHNGDLGVMLFFRKTR
jgi:cyclopropane fatty-acyl-phospholipid synthase-like methyltransferase